MSRILKLSVLLTGFVLLISLPASTTVSGSGKGQDESVSTQQVRARDERRRIRQGLEIAPVPLNFRRRDRDLVGLGSYIVNAQALCSDCHTCPTYTPGQNPFQGGDGQINAENYLAGGTPFGPIVSANITPDESGRPGGLTFDEFLQIIRTGRDPHESGRILQVMPWPILRNMTDRDILAIYTYLSAIPHAEPGSCSGPGE